MFRLIAALFYFCSTISSVSALEELLATRTKKIHVSPYDPDCVNFRLAVFYASQHATRRIGFLAFTSDRNSIVTQDPHDAVIVHLDGEGGLRDGLYYLGSRKRAARRGWGPLKLHSVGGKHPPKEYETWNIDGADHAHLSNPIYTYGHGEALFCLSNNAGSITSLVLAQYEQAVPAKFHCKPIYLFAQCVDKPPPPNPSDDSTPHHGHHGHHGHHEHHGNHYGSPGTRDGDDEEKMPAWEAGRRYGVV